MLSSSGINLQGINGEDDSGRIETFDGESTGRVRVGERKGCRTLCEISPNELPLASHFRYDDSAFAVLTRHFQTLHGQLMLRGASRPCTGWRNTCSERVNNHRRTIHYSARERMDRRTPPSFPLATRTFRVIHTPLLPPLRR